MKKLGFIILTLFPFNFHSHGQINATLDSALTITSVCISYAYQFPGGHMAERFGNNSNIGGQVTVKLKSNFMIGIKGGYIFGSTVKETNVLDNIRTVEGGIIERGGQLTDPIMDESGYELYLIGGYIWPVIGPNRNSGLIFNLGMGILQHQIIIDYRDADIPQLSEEYRKGYDRLSNGFALNQFVGYIHHGNRRMINFYVGLDLTEAWTKNKRGFNYDTGTSDNTVYFDKMLGLRFGWMLTLYKRRPDEFYYN